MPITRDKPVHVMTVKCELKPYVFGCRVVYSVQRNTREECIRALESYGWRLHPGGRTLCGPCSERERDA